MREETEAAAHEQVSARSSGRVPNQQAARLGPRPHVECPVPPATPSALHCPPGLRKRTQSSHGCKKWWDFNVFLFFPPKGNSCTF